MTAFLSPLWGLRGNVHCSSHSGLPIRINRTFFARCYGRGTASENRMKIGVFEGVDQFWPNFRVKGTSAANHFWSNR